MKVRDLLTDESKWTKNASARAACGSERFPTATDATCWCLTAAVERCYPSGYADVFNRIRERLRLGNHSIVHWNDQKGRTFPEVRALVEELDI